MAIPGSCRPPSTTRRSWRRSGWCSRGGGCRADAAFRRARISARRNNFKKIERRHAYRAWRDRAGPTRLLALAADLLELGEHRIDIELLAGHFLLRLRLVARHGGLGGRQQSRALGLDIVWLLLGGAVHLEVEVDLRAEPERYRVEGLQILGVPMGALADRLDGRFGGADQAHYLAVLQFRMVAHQPEDGVGPVLAARDRRIARALLAGGLGQADLRIEDLELVAGIRRPLVDLVAGQLAGEDRVE